MHHILGFLFWLLNRGPIALGGLAVAILGLGFYLQIDQNDRNAAKLAAIAAGPPPVVDISKYNRDRDVTAHREIVVRAQPVIENGYRLTYSENFGDDYAFMVPLVDTAATGDKVVMGIALYHSRSFTFDDITPDLMLDGMVGFGAIGPIVEINGRVASLGKWQDMTDEAFAEQGLTLASNAVVVWPYLEGREAALTPSDLTIFKLFSYVAGALGLLALAKLVLVNKPDDTGAAPDVSAPQPVMANTFDAMPAAAPSDSTVPLWKQRAGLPHDPPDTPMDPVASAHLTAPLPDPVFTKPIRPTGRAALEAPVLPARPKVGLRKILIGIVGALFVLGLMSTVSQLLGEARMVEAQTAAPLEQTVASIAADTIVPDTDPDRHWTDIDVTPVIEWFTAQALLAAAGDADAQIALGMIIGGFFVSMFMLRFFFTMRSALRPRTTARFDSMGIN